MSKVKKLHKDIQGASDRKILRQQMKLLAEYSRVPEAKGHRVSASYGVLAIYRELLKAKRVTIIGLAGLGIFLSLLYSVGKTFVKLFKSE